VVQARSLLSALEPHRGACGVYCLFTGRFPFLARIGMTVAGRKLESGTNRLGFLNLILTAIAFIGTLVYMGCLEAQGPGY
jgi:hypothetical protein